MSDLQFPSLKVKAFMIFWRVLWWIATPFILIYLWRRGQGDALYRKHLPERFGFHQRRTIPHIWVHAVSIGELRSAVPLIKSLLEDGEHIVTTHFTPVGRRAAQKDFAEYIATGQLSAVWVPFDYDAAFKRFFRAFKPKYGLVMEVEFWPSMIMSSQKSGIPLFLCNGQYPTRSFERDRGKWLSRANIVAGFAGVMVKSQRQADRFESLGVAQIEITGELRFEQPIPTQQLLAGEKAAIALADNRHVIGFASVVVGEDSLFIDAMKRIQENEEHLFVYVPRAPERFDETVELLQNAGLVCARRSDVFDDELVLKNSEKIDVLVGDSLGEMYFYLAICDRIHVGGGFTSKGSHNISEPLAVGKPVSVGTEVWTIEFPVIEAIDAGVCTQSTADTLAKDLTTKPSASSEQIAAFMTANGGAVVRTRAAILRLLAPTSH